MVSLSDALLLLLARRGHLVGGSRPDAGGNASSMRRGQMSLPLPALV
jgi:hypothetical protein